MTTFQKVIKCLAVVLAVFLIVVIVSAIVSVVTLIEGIFDKSYVSDGFSAYVITEEVTSLDIEIGAADVKVTHNDGGFEVMSNLTNTRIDVRNGELRVHEQTTRFKSYDGAMILINIPDNYHFDTVDIEMGAGRLEITNFSANELSLTLGAGETVITGVSSQRKTDIEGGAGRITASLCSFSGLDLEMGVGEMHFSGSLPGTSELDLGIGSVYINLLPDHTEYTVEPNKGIGDITVDGLPVSNGGRYGNGKNLVRINGGIGSVEVYFGSN